MDKRDLLKSFSKVHNRPLQSLTEIIKDPTGKLFGKNKGQADALISQAKSDPNQFTFGSPLTGQTPAGEPVGVFVTAKGVTKGGRLGADGRVQGGKNQYNLDIPTGDRGLEGFYKLFDTDGPQEVQPVIDEKLDSELSKLGIDVSDPAVAAPFKELYDEAVRVSDRGDAKRLVKSLVADYPVVVKDGEFYRIEPRQSDIERATQLANVINDKGSDDFCGRFKKTDKGDVVVYTDFGEGSNGTVFSKSQAKVLNRMIEGCEDPEVINVIQEASDNIGSESNIRGNVLEYPPDLFALARTYLKNKDSLSENESKKALGMIKDVALKIEKGIRSLNENREAWLKMARDSAIPLESQAEFDKIVDLLGDEGENIKAAFHVASVSNIDRLPNLSVRSGEVVGKGRKQDSVEIWYDETDAREALGKKVKPVNAEELFKSLGKEDYYKELVEAKYLTPGQEIYIGEISYKNYIAKSAETVMGSFSDKNTAEFMSGRSRNPVWKRFSKAVNLKEISSEFDEINRQQMEIRKQVDSLSNEISTMVDGKKVQVNALNTVVDGYLENIQKNSSFDGLQKNELAKTLKTKVKAYNNAKPSDKKKIENEIKDALLMPALMSNLQSNRADNPKAVQAYALALNYAPGASQSNDTILQTNMLNEGVSFITTQNKAYQEIANSIKNETGAFFLEITDTGLSFKRSDNRNSSITLKRVKGNLQSRKSNAMTREGEQKRFLGGKPSREDSSTIWTALSTLQEALGIIKEKVRILDAD
jgi:ribosome-binding protein aMBF1 (putative translation factor)